MKQKEIRWKQRLQNFEKAYSQLTEGIKLKKPNKIEKQGIIQSFEFTFELSWKTLKDYLENQGLIAKFPREVLKHAFQNDLIENGDIWIDMLDKRNLISHTYDEKKADEVYLKIKEDYYPAITQVFNLLKKKQDE